MTFSAGFARQVDGDHGAEGGKEGELSSVEAVGLSPTSPLAVTGSLSGVLGVWDMPTQKLRQKCIHKVWSIGARLGWLEITCILCLQVPQCQLVCIHNNMHAYKHTRSINLLYMLIDNAL